MSSVTRFVPKAERIKRDKAEDFRQYVLAFDGLSESLRESVMIDIARHETGGITPRWNFNMLNPNQCLAVWNAIEELPPEDRPQEVDRLFKIVLTHLEINTGLVTLTREELAEKLGVPPNHISQAFGVLERLGVIRRERVKMAGMRGRGIARYRLNQHVAWNGSLEVRAAQASNVTPPLLTLMEGGLV